MANVVYRIALLVLQVSLTGGRFPHFIPFPRAATALQFLAGQPNVFVVVYKAAHDPRTGFRMAIQIHDNRWLGTLGMQTCSPHCVDII